MTDGIASSSSEAFDPNGAVAGGALITGTGTLVSGQNLAKYTVLGRITASGKYTQAVDTASDGSQKPVAILMHDTDASGGDTACQVWKGGNFVKDMLIWDASYTATEQESEFDGTPINLVSAD